MAHHAARGHPADGPLALPELQLPRGQARGHIGPVAQDRRRWPRRQSPTMAPLALLAEAGGDGSMRDALCIMDQAIIHARPRSPQPMETAGKAATSTHRADSRADEHRPQRRPSNCILEAVDARPLRRSHDRGQLATARRQQRSPAQLARQCVRYLRNALVARIAGLTPESATEGLGNELLQISPDEQRRARPHRRALHRGRAHRFLQVMLRTFDRARLPPGTALPLRARPAQTRPPAPPPAHRRSPQPARARIRHARHID